MKISSFCNLVLIVSISMFSCKKTNDAANPGSNLKGSMWAGEFKYTSGGYTGLQPFSILLNSDSTATWADVVSTRSAGKWKVNGGEITIIFPNNVSFSATLSPDNWTNFSTQASNGFAIDNLSHAVAPDVTKLTGSMWSGLFYGQPLKIKFLAGTNIEISQNGIKLASTIYTTDQAGLRISQTYTNGGDNFFMILNSTGTIMTGIRQHTFMGAITYANWYASKQ